MHLNQRNKGYRRLHNFMHFLEIHNPFKASSSDLINIATGTIASSDVNVDSLIDISKRILQKVVNKSLSKITLKKKDQARTFAIMKEAVKIDGKEIIIGTIISETVCISCSGQLMEDVLSCELGAVAPALFLDNSMMHKTSMPELRNALLALSPCIVKTYSGDSYHVIDGCA